MDIRNLNNNSTIELRVIIYVCIVLLGLAIALRSYTYSLEQELYNIEEELHQNRNSMKI